MNAAQALVEARTSLRYPSAFSKPNAWRPAIVRVTQIMVIPFGFGEHAAFALGAIFLNSVFGEMK